MSSCRRSENFKVALGILLDIKNNNGKLESDLDKDTLKLWLYTLIGMGYIRKETRDYYVITEKGRKELHQHLELNHALVSA